MGVRRMLKPRGILVASVIAVLCGCASAPASPGSRVATDSLNLATDPGQVLEAARRLMESDENMALVTVDDNGQPRIRTVKAFLSDVDPADPRASMTVWVMTRDSTRKVEQIRNHPQVSLYFNDDAKVSYLTVMGTALVHTDPRHPAIQALLARPALEGYADYFWPDFPKGFVMLEIQPGWIEFMDQEKLKPHGETWRPQAVVFDWHPSR